jgi:hypothetical protein
MDNSEIQKLISIFLGLAIIISSGTFIFLDLFSSQNKISVENSLVQDSNNSKSEFEGKTAFVESPKSLPSYYTTISLDSEFQPSGNLTDDYASYAAREIVKVNPNGPQVDESGNQNIAVPDVDKLSTDFVSNIVSKTNLPDIKDWDKEVDGIISKTKFIEKISTSTVISYFKNFSEINRENLKYQDLINNIENNNNIEIIANVGEQSIYKTINEFKNIEVPEIFLDFHKSFIKLLVYQKNILKISPKINNDPMYIVYFTNKVEGDYNKIIEDFNNKYNEVLHKKIYTLQTKNNLFSLNFIINNFTINKANALFGIPEPVIEVGPLLGIEATILANSVAQTITQTMSFGQKILEWLKKLATEIVKDQLIHRLINQIIRWVQGGGKPQFITNWKGFLEDTASRGAGLALQKIYPQICQPFQPLIRIAFQSVNTYDNYVSCTLGDIVNNLKNFYNDFKYGNWISYASVINPNGNFFGQLIISRDIVLEEAAKEKESQKSSAESGRGFLPTKVCVKQKIVDIDPKIALTMPSVPGVQIRCGPIDEPGFALPKGACVSITCEQYEDKTPGTLVADIVGQSLPMGPIGRIVNAQDITALVSALVNSGLMKLIKAGERGLAGVLNNSSDWNTNVGGKSTNICFDLDPSTKEYEDCIRVSNSSTYEVSDTDSQIAIIGSARNTLKNLQDALTANKDALKIIDDVIPKLETIGGCQNGIALCLNLKDSACDLILKLEKRKDDIINTENPSLQQSINNLSNLLNNISSIKLDINQLQNTVSLTNRYVDSSNNYPIEKKNKVEKIQTAVDQNINQSPQCQVELPSF